MIEIKQKHNDTTIWLKDLEAGDTFVDPSDGGVYIVLCGGTSASVRCLRFKPLNILFKIEETPVLKVNLNIEWEVQC